MVNYANCKIYKLVLKGGDELNDMYIGSTCTPLCKRMSDHRANARAGKPAKVYLWMRNVGVENVEIILVADCPCENYEEQRRHERRYVDEIKPSLNMLAPYNSQEECTTKQRAYIKEYREHNKQALSEKMRTYYERNREAILEYNRAYVERNKEAIAKRSREYRARNNDALSDKNRDYYQRNKEAICKKVREYQNRNKDVINALQRQRYLEKKLLKQAEQSS